MKKLILAFLLMSTPVLAQTSNSESSLQPIVITVEELSSLQAYLEKQPYSFSAPLVQFLARKENKAISEASKAGKK